MRIAESGYSVSPEGVIYWETVGGHEPTGDPDPPSQEQSHDVVVRDVDVPSPSPWRQLFEGLEWGPPDPSRLPPASE